MRKNTAPCIAYAAHKIHAQNENANLIVAPSDHLILNEDTVSFQSLTTSIEKAQEGQIVTLGIKPSRPDTGYGYIHFDAASGTDLGNSKGCESNSRKNLITTRHKSLLPVEITIGIQAYLFGKLRQLLMAYKLSNRKLMSYFLQKEMITILIKNKHSSTMRLRKLKVFQLIMPC